MFGDDEEEEQEEISVGSWEELSEEELNNIISDVRSMLSKCKNDNDLKAYAGICASSLTNDKYYSYLIARCFEIAGDAGGTNYLLSDRLEKGEIRNIRFLCEEFDVDFEEKAIEYIDHLTPWDDAFAREFNLSVNEKEFVIDEFQQSLEFKILMISLLTAISDYDFKVGDQLINKALLFIKELAILEGSSSVDFPSNFLEIWNESIQPKFYEGETDDLISPLKELSDALNKAIEDETQLDQSPWDKNRQDYCDMVLGKISNLLDEIDLSKYWKVVYASAFLFAKSDADEWLGYDGKMVMTMFQDDEPRFEKDEINKYEQQCIDLILKKSSPDEDALYGFQSKLEDGVIDY